MVVAVAKGKVIISRWEDIASKEKPPCLEGSEKSCISGPFRSLSYILSFEMNISKECELYYTRWKGIENEGLDRALGADVAIRQTVLMGLTHGFLLPVLWWSSSPFWYEKANICGMYPRVSGSLSYASLIIIHYTFIWDSLSLFLSLYLLSSSDMVLITWEPQKNQSIQANFRVCFPNISSLDGKKDYFLMWISIEIEVRMIAWHAFPLRHSYSA